MTLVVPVFNESRRIDQFAPDLIEFIATRPAGSELVFVDDGSTDATVDQLEALRRLVASKGACVRVLRCAHHGKGAAVRAGLQSAATPLAGFCDLDLSTPLADFLRIVDAADEAPILAIASRGLAASRLTRHQSRAREFLGRTFNKIVQLALVPGVVDTQCGAKVARTELWRSVLPLSHEDGFAWDVEIIAIARRLGVSVQEIAVEWRHEDESKVRVGRDGAAMLRALVRIRRGLPAHTPGVAVTSPAPLGTGTARAEDRVLSPRVSALLDADDGHWWFRSNATFVDWALKRWSTPHGRLVDLGGGTGGMTAKLGWAPSDTIVVESSPELSSEAHRRHALEVVQSELERVALVDDCASVVCALDLLEQRPDSSSILREAARVLDPEGRLIVIVPAHPRLWSASDEVLGHARRYTRRALRSELETADFEILFCSHIFSLLVVPVWLRRRRNAGTPELGLDIDHAFVDRSALLIARLERFVLRRVQLPVGTSILCVAKVRRTPGT